MARRRSVPKRDTEMNDDLARQLRPRLGLALDHLAAHVRSLFDSSPPSVLYHYTGLDGAAGIISSRSLRLTKFTHLNDQREFLHAVDVLATELRVACKRETNQGVCALLETITPRLDTLSNINICVASFCMGRDLLSQWQSYGRAGRGVALGFKTGELKKAGQLIKCVYEYRDQQAIIRETLNLLIAAHHTAIGCIKPEEHAALPEILHSFFLQLFLQVAFALKNKHFEVEGEWRLVTPPQSNIDPAFQSIVSDNRVSVFRRHDFPNAFLAEVVVGPGNNFGRVSEAIWLLAQDNHAQFSVINSTVPLRV